MYIPKWIQKLDFLLRQSPGNRLSQTVQYYKYGLSCDRRFAGASR